MKILPLQWVPKVGDYVICHEFEDQKYGGIYFTSKMSELIGKIGKIQNVTYFNENNLYVCYVLKYSWPINALRKVKYEDITK